MTGGAQSEISRHPEECGRVISRVATMRWMMQAARMRNRAAGDAWKIGLFAMAATGLAAWLAPVIFQGGKALAEVGGYRTANRPMEWFSRWSADAGFHQFFTLTLLAVAAVLLVPLLDWLSKPAAGGAAARAGRGPWHLRLPRAAELPAYTGQPLRWTRDGAVWGACGFFFTLTAGLLAGALLLPGPTYEWRGIGLSWRLGAGLGGAMLTALAWEWIFRGVVMGVLLRAMAPAIAVGGTALVFAGARLLVPAQPLGEFEDPESWRLGWQYLGQLAARVGDSGFLASTVFPLLAWGGLLGYARWRTASLWLPVALHAGWLCAGRLFETCAGATGKTTHAMLDATVPGAGPAFVAWGTLVAAGITIHLVTQSAPTAADDDETA